MKKMLCFLAIVFLQLQAYGAIPTSSATIAELAKNPIIVPMDDRGDPSKASFFHKKEARDVLEDPSLVQGRLIKKSASGQGSSSNASINFTAVTLSDTGAIPPDSMGHVGPSQYIAFCNGWIRSFNKTTGRQDGALNMTPETFFQLVLPTGGFASDPRIRYDRMSGYWFVTMLGIAGDLSYDVVMLAYTADSTITSSSSWTFIAFSPSLLPDDFGDFPTLGVDQNALYIGINEFSNTTGNFRNSQAIVIPKEQLTSSAPLIEIFYMGDLLNPTTFAGPYIPQGVDNFDSSPILGYFIGVDGDLFGRLILIRIQDPGTNPSILDMIPISVASTAYPINVPFKGNNGGAQGRLEGLDDRLCCAHIRNNHLYTVHNIGTNSSGVSSPNQPMTADGSRWYDINITNSSSPKVVQIGTLYDPSRSTSGRNSYWMPSVMTNGLISMVLGCSTSGANTYSNASYAVRYQGDPSGTLRPPVLYTKSQSSYNPPFDQGGPEGRRWGDYSYTSLDPNDNMTMWTIQEFCNTTNSYGCQVVRILAAPPATPVSCNPSAIPSGSSKVSVVITGKSINGSAFYNPPSDFTNHLSLSLGDVKVVSIDGVTSTKIYATISTVGAAKGQKKVVVTNPDGQQSSGKVLTIK